MACLDCLSDEKTLIPSPICQSDCDNIPQCEDELNSNCITVTPALPCINTQANTALTLILQAIDAKLCQSVNNLNNCKVKVSATDNCCDFLDNKISVANGLVKTKTATSCEKIQISHPTWNSVTFNQVVPQGFVMGSQVGTNIPKAHTYFNGAQRVHEVKLTGLITVSSAIINQSFKNDYTYLTKLPYGIPAPLEDYYHSYTKILLGGKVMAANILIAGQITLLSSPGNIMVWILSDKEYESNFSLDGINYII